MPVLLTLTALPAILPSFGRLSATSNISGFISVTYAGWPSNASSRLNLAIFISVILHAAVLLGVDFTLPVSKSGKSGMPLEVVLVNSKPPAPSRAKNTNVLAQTNEEGVGTPDHPPPREAAASFPTLPVQDNAVAAEPAHQQMEQPEQEAPRLTTTVDDDQGIYEADDAGLELVQKGNIFDAVDLVQRSFEIARLEGRTTRNYETYQKPSKRRFLGARTQEYRFARYLEDWRIKVERIGNLNYPEAAKREKLYGNLQLTVGIKADGSLESIALNRSSGKKVLDEAALRIVKLAGQYGFAPFPPEISQDTDILYITRTWVFTRSDELASQ